jgi:hypothetical protein
MVLCIDTLKLSILYRRFKYAPTLRESDIAFLRNYLNNRYQDF